MSKNISLSFKFNASFAALLLCSSAALIVFPNSPFSPDKLAIDIPANITNIIIVITNATSVIPLFFCFFLHKFLPSFSKL